ncbi:MAG: methylaspartate mutase subunit S [Syntrophales bacterium]|nr:methylaspartate mutase subunit S [Syntrophales bacterium]
MENTAKDLKEISIVTGTIGQDAHSIGTALLSRFLREKGFKVTELRALVQPDEFIEVAKETNAAAILISSLYGMGEMDLKGFKEKCVESGLKDVLLYVGGYLKIGRHDWGEDEKRFKKMGFDRVYPPEVSLDTVFKDLTADLKKK